MNPSARPPEVAPQVSVIVPAYNAAKYLKETLQSVRDQSFEAWECVIVDDGSRDQTALVARAMAAQDERIRFFQQENQGVSRARNFGFEQSNPLAPLVAFLDADDLWDARTLETLVQTLGAHPTAVGCHCNAFYIDGDGQRIREGVLESSIRSRYFFDGRRVQNSRAQDPTTFAAAITNCPIITTGCVLMRREAFEQIGGFDASLRQGEDWDVWIRLARMSDLIFVDQAFLAYRRHGDNSSVDRRTAIAQVQKIRRKTIDSPDNTPAQRLLARKVYRAFYWRLARERYPRVGRQLLQRKFKDALQTLIFALFNTAMAIKGRP